MKILHLISSLASRFGGPSKACIEMADAVNKLGHEVSIYSTTMDGKNDLSKADFCDKLSEKIDLQLFQVNWPRFWIPSLSMARALKKKIKEFDIVHIHSLYLFHNLVGAYYCRTFCIPYIIRPHGTLDPFLYKRHRFRKALFEILFENRNLKNADAIHFTTTDEMELAKPHTFEAPGIVIPNGLHLEEYEVLPDKGYFRAKYPETIGKKLILFFSRINFKKGLDILIPAFIKLARKHPDYHLVLVGPDDSNLTPGIKKELLQAGLALEGPYQRTTFTGMLSGKDKLAVLNDSDVFVLPSYSENFGIAVIEAMICKLPVIISDKVNIWREVVEDGAGLAGPCLVEWFSEAIERLLNNPEQCAAMGQAGQKSVKNRYSWDQIAIQLENAYTTIIQNHQRSRIKE
ncbi:MAG: glycosyltransferase [Candidatus Riflebacteria bacterium]|nr:glycosyltransferase [Candidatus Riflebacteria bacterium]